MKFHSVIFARGGSKGLPRKNLLELCGKPLIGWAVEQARAVPMIDRVIVSTDCEEIAAAARTYGAEVPFMRPQELADDTAPEWLAWRHAVEFLKKDPSGLPDGVVSVPTTSPLRDPLDIENCLAVFEKERPDAVVTVTEAHRNPFFNVVKPNPDGSCQVVCAPEASISRRQNAPTIFDLTTVAYVVCPQFVLTGDRLFDGKVYPSFVPKERSIDIDDLYDFKLAEFLMMQKQ